MSPRKVLGFVGAFLFLISLTAAAQSSIGGRVTDNTGGVLPGVTVEAASPVLIEGTRTAVADGNGQYRIVDLRPGTYSVTFSLIGFSGDTLYVRTVFCTERPRLVSDAGGWFPTPIDRERSANAADGLASEIDPFVELHPMGSINEVLAQMRRHALRKRPVLVPGPAPREEGP